VHNIHIFFAGVVRLVEGLRVRQANGLFEGLLAEALDGEENGKNDATP